MRIVGMADYVLMFEKFRLICFGYAIRHLASVNRASLAWLLYLDQFGKHRARRDAWHMHVRNDPHSLLVSAVLPTLPGPETGVDFECLHHFVLLVTCFRVSCLNVASRQTTNNIGTSYYSCMLFAA